MALFYPPVDFSTAPIIEKAGDLAERKVIEALAGLDGTWHIFHTTDWRSIDKVDGERIGEVDLIVFHPHLGILFVEIKGGGIILEAGKWYYRNSFTGEMKESLKMSPLKQAYRSQRYFAERLERRSLGQGILKSTAITHTAWFPDIEWNAPLPPEIPNASFLLDARHLGDPEKAIGTILTQSSPHSEKWTKKEINTLIEVIAPEVNLMQPLAVDIGTIRDRLFRMTDNQIETLRVLRNINRLLVEGCAGSGKTLLAVQLAHDHLLQGKRVLLTCYNKNLAAFLLRKFDGFENIDVLNFHELVRKRCEQFNIPYNVPKEAAALPEFFRTTCPELLEQSLTLDTVRYDSIIVDEAFDFLDIWWIALEGLGIPSCAMYAFYDTNQGVFNTKEGWMPPFAAIPIRLETNLRNTRPVGEFAVILGQLTDSARYAVDAGPDPEVISYATPAEMVQKVLKIIGELIKSNVRMDDIVVLAPYKHTSSHVGLGAVVAQNPEKFTTVMSSAPGGKVRVGTIQTFKGLEADVVILCGLDGQLPACKPANLYVGASRARSKLYLLHQSDFMV